MSAPVLIAELIAWKKKQKQKNFLTKIKKKKK